MNWRTGLFRIWVLLSVFWVVLIFWVNYNSTFFRLPAESEIDEAKKIIRDSYNCNELAQFNPKLNTLLSRNSENINKALDAIVKSEIEKRQSNNSGSEIEILMNMVPDSFEALKKQFLSNLTCSGTLKLISNQYLSNDELVYIQALKAHNYEKNGMSMRYMVLNEGPTFEPICSSKYYLKVVYYGHNLDLCDGDNINSELTHKLSALRNSGIADFSLIAFFPPVLLFVAGISCMWVFSGFGKGK